MKENPNDILGAFKDFLEAHSLVKPGDRVLIAVSGGVDSMVLLDLFKRIRSTFPLHLSVVHVNHQLRGSESEEDEAFVKRTVIEAGLTFHASRVNVREYQSTQKISRQEAARELRYKAFETARVETESNVIATAHNADDNAETVLMNAMRGAGIRGLSGIPIRREPGAIIRPLLFASRGEIESCAISRGIGFREDSSNASKAYTRNHLRLEILPALSREFQTDVIESLNRVSSLMRSLGEVISREMVSIASSALSRDIRGDTRVSIALLRQQPLFMQDELILHVMRALGIEPGAQRIQACLALCDQPTGRVLELSGGWTVLHDRTHLVFSQTIEDRAFEREVKVGEEYVFQDFRFSVKPLTEVPGSFIHAPGIEFADADRLGRHLVVRSWKRGDWFVPLGLGSRKKLSDFFVNSKLPRTEKNRTPILESDGAIVWVCGLRLDERFCITPSTRRAVQLTYHPLHSQ